MRFNISLFNLAFLVGLVLLVWQSAYGQEENGNAEKPLDPEYVIAREVEGLIGLKRQYKNKLEHIVLVENTTEGEMNDSLQYDYEYASSLLKKMEEKYQHINELKKNLEKTPKSSIRDSGQEKNGNTMDPAVKNHMNEVFEGYEKFRKEHNEDNIKSVKENRDKKERGQKVRDTLSDLEKIN